MRFSLLCELSLVATQVFLNLSLAITISSSPPQKQGCKEAKSGKAKKKKAGRQSSKKLRGKEAKSGEAKQQSSRDAQEQRRT